MKPYIALGVLSLGLYFAYQLILVDARPRHRHEVVQVEPRSDQPSGQFSWQGSLASGQSVEVHGLNGGITAGPADGSQVVVTARKTARRSDPSSVKIEVVERGNGVIVCAVYPGGDSGCGESGLSSGRANDVSVQFDIRIPHGVTFVGRTVNGSVKAEGLDDDVDVQSVNGSITIDTRGSARAQTVNGSIKASLGAVTGFDGLDFNTTNGTITLSLPSDVQAVLEGHTNNGSIASEFPLQISGNRQVKEMHGTLGQGGDLIKLQSLNGSIRIIERR